VGIRSLVACSVVVVSSGLLAADDRGEGAVEAVATSPGVTVIAAATRTRPWVHPTVPSDVAAKLGAAIDLASDRVARFPACADLFSSLGADATRTLESVLYLPAAPENEAEACRHILAHTFVGDSRTWVCSRITEVSDSQAAMVVIHEALHHAGLSERGRDRRAMTSARINEMVSVRCRL
jgi:hypothetical protein